MFRILRNRRDGSSYDFPNEVEGQERYRAESPLLGDTRDFGRRFATAGGPCGPGRRRLEWRKLEMLLNTGETPFEELQGISQRWLRRYRVVFGHLNSGAPGAGGERSFLSLA